MTTGSNNGKKQNHTLLVCLTKFITTWINQQKICQINQLSEIIITIQYYVSSMQIAGLGTRGSGTCGTGTAVLGHAELGQFL